MMIGMYASVCVLERIQGREKCFKSFILIQVSCALLKVIIVITGLRLREEAARKLWQKYFYMPLLFCEFDLWINVFFSDRGLERKVVDKKCWRKSGPELISRLRRKQEATLLRRRLLPSQSRMRHKIWNIFPAVFLQNLSLTQYGSDFPQFSSCRL